MRLYGSHFLHLFHSNIRHPISLAHHDFTVISQDAKFVFPLEYISCRHATSREVLRDVKPRNKCPGCDHFSKFPVITESIRLFCFPFQMGVSKGLKVLQ